jgi:hypothetical protein
MTTEEFGKFDALVGRVLSLSHSEIMRRESEYKKQSESNPKRRGPKRKSKPSVSGREAKS